MYKHQDKPTHPPKVYSFFQITKKIFPKNFKPLVYIDVLTPSNNNPTGVLAVGIVLRHNNLIINKMEKTVKRREIKRLPGKKAYYANGETPVADQKENFKGKSYYTFAHGANAFAVHEDDDFIKDWDNNEVAEATIDITEAGATFLIHATYKQLLNEATFDGDMDYARNRYKYEASKPLTIANLEESAGL